MTVHIIFYSKISYSMILHRFVKSDHSSLAPCQNFDGSIYLFLTADKRFMEDLSSREIDIAGNKIADCGTQGRSVTLIHRRHWSRRIRRATACWNACQSNLSLKHEMKQQVLPSPEKTRTHIPCPRFTELQWWLTRIQGPILHRSFAELDENAHFFAELHVSLSIGDDSELRQDRIEQRGQSSTDLARMTERTAFTRDWSKGRAASFVWGAGNRRWTNNPTRIPGHISVHTWHADYVILALIHATSVNSIIKRIRGFKCADSWNRGGKWTKK